MPLQSISTGTLGTQLKPRMAPLELQCAKNAPKLDTYLRSRGQLALSKGIARTSGIVVKSVRLDKLFRLIGSHAGEI
jgi:hypothetical protein